MFPLNQPQRLSVAAFWYSALPAIAVSFVAVIIGAFIKDFIASTCATAACPVFAPLIMPVLVIVFVAAVLAHPILDFMLFSYSLAEHSITINSGIIFRQYETIDFNRIQTLDLERGPILWLFGLTEVRLWTASADQFNFSDITQWKERAKPDTTLILARNAAESMRDFIANTRHGMHTTQSDHV